MRPTRTYQVDVPAPHSRSHAQLQHPENSLILEANADAGATSDESAFGLGGFCDARDACDACDADGSVNAGDDAGVPCEEEVVTFSDATAPGDISLSCFDVFGSL